MLQAVVLHPLFQLLKQHWKQNRKVVLHLVYGNRSRSSIIFFEELEGLKNKYLQRFNFINILSREKTDAPINFGRINYRKTR